MVPPSIQFPFNIRSCFCFFFSCFSRCSIFSFPWQIRPVALQIVCSRLVPELIQSPLWDLVNFGPGRGQRQNAKNKNKGNRSAFSRRPFCIFFPGAFVSFVFLLMFLHVPSQTISSNKLYQFRNTRGHPRSAVLSLFSYKCTDSFCLASLQWLNKPPQKKKETKKKTRCSPRTRMLTRMLAVQMSKHMDMQSRRTLL